MSSIDIDESRLYSVLRNRAEGRLKAGASPAQCSMGLDALRRLYQLSSNPASAEDALRLLHELQVHQMEIDLQNEEIAANEQALSKELSLYQELYDSAPIGYFLVDREGVVIQANTAAAALLGTGQGDLVGQAIDTFLAPENRPRLLELLLRVEESGAGGSCMAITAGSNVARRLQFLASFSSRHECVLLACCECPVDG
jgi:PAS domain-containing protein